MREARQGVKPQRFTASLWLPLLALYDRFLRCFWQSWTFGVEANIHLRQGSYVSKLTQTNEQILMKFYGNIDYGPKSRINVGDILEELWLLIFPKNKAPCF